jgi:hypothetical protein
MDCFDRTATCAYVLASGCARVLCCSVALCSDWTIPATSLALCMLPGLQEGVE